MPKRTLGCICCDTNYYRKIMEYMKWMLGYATSDANDKEKSIDDVVNEISTMPKLEEAQASIAKEKEQKLLNTGALLDPAPHISPELRAVLTADVYTALQALCELSYSMAYLYRGENSLVCQQAANNLKKLADDKLARVPNLSFQSDIIHGLTGNNNQKPDATCIVNWTVDKSLIVVSFHGSTSDKLFDFVDPTGDWGANLDYIPVKAQDLPDLAPYADVPGDVEMHGSFARNYASVHDRLKRFIRCLLENKKDPMTPITNIIFTGHSKGAALTTLAAAAITSYLKQNAVNYGQVFVVAFSSPRIMHNDRSQAWVHEMLGQTNILRINTSQDIVPLLPMDWLLHFRHVGVCRVDSTAAMLERVSKLYNVKFSHWWQWGNINAWATLHYGDNLRVKEMLLFDSDIVMPFGEIDKPERTLCSLAAEGLTSDPYSTF
jgi:hypothetical protein